MNYDLTIRIEGVAAYFKKDGITYVVLPNTLLGEAAPGAQDVPVHDTIDNEKLRFRHEPTLRAGDIAVPLRGCSIQIKAGEARQVEWKRSKSQGKALRLPQMSDVVGEYCGLAPQFNPLEWKSEEPNTVSAWLKIDRGTLTVFRHRGQPRVDRLAPIPGLRGVPTEDTLIRSSGLEWTIPDLGGDVVVEIQPFGAATKPLQLFVPRKKRQDKGKNKLIRTIEIFNHRSHSNHPPTGDGDVDFRWYYELLADRATVADHLEKKSLRSSIPVYDSTDLVASSPGINIFTPCRPCEFCV